MNILVGIDIIEISRIKESIQKYGEKFLKRVYTENEINYCESKKDQKYESYAARFAAKEAVFKAISDMVDAKFNWNDIEIINEKNGKPKVRLNIDVNQIEQIEISLSHSKAFAVANAFAIQKEN